MVAPGHVSAAASLSGLVATSEKGLEEEEDLSGNATLPRPRNKALLSNLVSKKSHHCSFLLNSVCLSF